MPHKSERFPYGKKGKKYAVKRLVDFHMSILEHAPI